MGFCSACSSPSAECVCIPRNIKTENINTPQKEPPTRDKIVSFSISLLKHAKNLFENVPDPIQKNRLQICQECPFFNPENLKCNKCGCFLMSKTSWASESCPEGKWSSQERRKINKNDCGCSKKDKN